MHFAHRPKCIVRDHSQFRMEAKPFDGLLERKRIDGLFYQSNEMQLQSCVIKTHEYF